MPHLSLNVFFFIFAGEVATDICKDRQNTNVHCLILSDIKWVLNILTRPAVGYFIILHDNIKNKTYNIITIHSALFSKSSLLPLLSLFSSPICKQLLWGIGFTYHVLEIYVLENTNVCEELWQVRC